MEVSKEAVGLLGARGAGRVLTLGGRGALAEIGLEQIPWARPAADGSEVADIQVEALVAQV